MRSYSFSISRLCVLIAFILSAENFEEVVGSSIGNESTIIHNLNRVTTIRMPLENVKLKSSGEILVQNINVVSPFTSAILNITNIESDVNFFVTEVHSHLNNVTLSYQQELVPHTYVTANRQLMPSYLNTSVCYPSTTSIKCTCRKRSNHRTYFDSYKKMMTVNTIKTNGRKVLPSLMGSIMQRIYSAYTGTGSVYAVIVSSGFDRESAYVPAQTYACGSAENGNSKCALLSSSSKSSLLMLCLFCAGLALCYTGHAYFTLELFIFATVTGTLILNILFMWLLPDQGVFFLSSLTGTAFGCVWCMLWILLGIPIFSVLLPVLTCGYLCTASLFYFLADYIEVLQEVQEIDINYWLALLCGTLSFTILLLLKPCEASIISSAFVGSYMIIFPIDNYLGSNLKFILVNTIRRATVDGFSSAITSPPFQYSDFILLITWLAQTGFGYAVQRVSLVGRPPFPHNRRLLRRSSTPDERSPLLRPGAISNIYVSSADN
ncbi:hypothetical protein LSTR_LSTR005681 [Laodelphax striatellus]|uniref:TM7S3/TM198-like domain-containing protein n=1 Tax=Laodelphax striatellus TaxID=195883 RepID=A0A482X849_LAOST|nr:hypothetical protein LSTR_LSTR005681 [Laodelphax striatellus]